MASESATLVNLSPLHQRSTTQDQNTINIAAIQCEAVSTVSFLHVRELCLGSLQRLHIAEAC